ncbi:MAG: oxidoreductase [Myxococcales bacterium]|nr:oxidoreductase [Myxococcales bacterium]
MRTTRKPKLAVFKLASCDGCQLSLLDCEDELLAVAGAVDIAHFLEASSRVLRGPYDLTLVEGSITNEHDLDRLRAIRANSKKLVTIGACATAGGIQALRNYGDVSEYTRVVYARPEYIHTLARSTGVAEHVRVDFELRGCPVDKHQLLEVLNAFLNGRPPRVANHSVCLDCKRAGAVCVMVAQGIPCLGPVTHTGCGALCPRYSRGCFGCFGPAESANPPGLRSALSKVGTSKSEIARLYSTFNAAAPAFHGEHRSLTAEKDEAK